MIISEKQIMQLITYTGCLISGMINQGAPMSSIEEISKVLDEITNQQSEELKVIDNHCQHDFEHRDYGTASYFKCLKCGSVK